MKYTLDDLMHIKGTSEPVRAMLQAQVAEIERLRKAAQMALEALLMCQEKIDGEWGSCRTNDQIEADGDTDPVITTLREGLK